MWNAIIDECHELHHRGLSVSGVCVKVKPGGLLLAVISVEGQPDTVKELRGNEEQAAAFSRDVMEAGQAPEVIRVEDHAGVRFVTRPVRWLREVVPPQAV